ncbi:MAG: ABC transporter ATP-binding protein [Alphaproteobacteria bacterium]
MAEPVLEARDVTRILPGPVPVTLVADISLSIGRGEFVAIAGPSGSGKSSLLYLLGLLDVPTRGRVLLEGRDTTEMDADELADLRLRRLGFVFQFHFLLPEFTVLDNIMVPMRRLGGRPVRAMHARAVEILESLGMESEINKRPDQLSGGQRQRAAIARALANDPLVVLADEPTGNLDTRSGHIVFDIFARLAREMGKTVVTVTHDTTLAAETDRRILIVDGRVAEPAESATH